MEGFYINYKLMQEKMRISEEDAAKYAMSKIARAGSVSSWSQFLVKLSGVLINTGLHLKAYAENEPANNSQFMTSLQK
ncbi:MAG: hypothetical protein MUO76_16295 [Anaerolineaceae bacterium]|nr:hypothetical protein [Anaerolineaceae bacterium]